MTAGWADGPMLSFDLETTSLSTSEARIVTASVVLIQPGAPSELTNWLVDPGVEIPAETTKKHGVTTEYAKDQGRSPREAVLEIATRVADAWGNGWPVIAYNAPYDLTVLHRELLRHRGDAGLGALSGPERVLGPVIDPLVLDKRVDRYRPGKRTLAVCCGHYGVELVDAHTSAADALATARVAWKIAKRYPEIGDMTLADLQVAQARWYQESQHSFADYLRGAVADQLRAEIEGASGDERDTKLAELDKVLGRADDVDSEAEGWPVGRVA